MTELPNEVLLYSFSFLLNSSSVFSKNPKLISPLSQVCKKWHTIANKNELWLQLIRPEYHSAYRGEHKESGMTAKEYYQKNIDARTNTYYLITEPVETGKTNWRNIPYTIFPVKHSKSLPKSENIQIFYSREEAIKCADNMSQVDEKAKFTDYIYHYTPILTIQIKETPLTPTTIKVCKVRFNYGEDMYNYYPCFEIPKTNVNRIYSLFYKTGTLGKNEKHHEVPNSGNVNNQEQEPNTKQLQSWCAIQ